ncbi:LCP family protein [Kitasatospora terrestris]|uniref:LCP family protein n=1 Tax=Kitasatospora terrestris TaxID=258051 RepID=A0ABP9DLW1_9ACTN
MEEEQDTGERPPTDQGGGRRSFVRRHWIALTGGTLALVMAVTGTLAWLAYRKLNGNIEADRMTGTLLGRASDRPARGDGQAENILLIGSDDRTGANGAYGEAGGQRSDTTILLHLAADRRHATAVSIPRDVMVTVPACDLPNGTRTRQQVTQFNAAFELGGPACTIRTVERLSGIRVDHHLILDFTGFKKMVDAVGGVEVCVPRAIHDRNAKLDLAAGRQTLTGEQALGYVRVRETIGDGSDTQRMGRQQQFLASLLRKVQSQGVLFNPARLWPLLDAATSAVKADPELSSLGSLYDLAQELRGMAPSNVALLTAPRRAYRLNANRDEFVQPQTAQLFAALRADQQVAVKPYAASPSAGPSASASASARPGAGASGYAAPGADGSVSAAPGAGDAAAAPEEGEVLEDPTALPSPSASGFAGSSPVLEGRTADQDTCGMH